ncbi:uncharacterized protein [Aegilops tauschii subsp. strangulata]|uniref:uncharacterized protein n=1 Tax=Aegilops tauschii subsp. strangulata TaxID=200361 RepID=UPI00098A143A
MAEEPSAKRHHGETSNKSTNLDDVYVPGEKRAYTTSLIGVELHGKETLEIVCTSEPDKADEMMSRLRMKGGGLYPSFIGVDVEYTNNDEHPQMAAVLQLCVEELCLVYHIAAATKWPKRLKEFLQEEKLYTFASFSIEGDKWMLNKSGLEINPNNFIDMQHNVIHPFYKGMKKKIDTEQDHKLWRTSPLPDKLIEYAGIDAYATYKSWKIIDNIMADWDISKEQEADPYYHCNFAG